MEDYAFGIGDCVLVGNNEGVVVGQSNTQHEPDSFKIKFTDEDGFPFSRWFPEHEVSKARMH